MVVKLYFRVEDTRESPEIHELVTKFKVNPTGCKITHYDGTEYTATWRDLINVVVEED